MTDSRRFSSSAFSPAAARQTSVALLRNVATGDHRLVTSISTRKSTEVLRINLRSGRLELENDRWAESSYANESEALDHLQGRGYEVLERGYALLGYAVAGPNAGLLLATRVREKAVLPGGHTVFAVTDSQWAIVALQNESADAAAAAALAGLPPPRGVSAAQDFWRALQQFTLNNAHYYCETADISRPFPSDHDARDPNPEFVWNSWLRQPLVELGLYDHCPALLQGAVECSTQVLPGQSSGRFSMCLISRRSRRHPGTRYIARGLNSLAGPGNEIECELVTWTHPEQRQYGGGTAPAAGAAASGSSFTTTSFSGLPGSSSSGSSSSSSGEPLRWARVVWRRGTVPIWWGVQLQSLAQGLQAEVYVREEHPYEGTASYFRNVQRQHVPHPAIPAPAGSGQSQQQAGAAPPGEAGVGFGGAGEGWTLVDEAGASEAGATSSSASGTARTAGGGEGAGSFAPPLQGAQQQQQQQGLPACGGGGAGSEGGEEALCRVVAVTCINLLHANPKKASELMLSSHFQDAMRHVRRRLGSDSPIKVVNFDWHGNMGRLTEEKAVEGFWSLMEPFVKQTGFACGWMEADSSSSSFRGSGGGGGGGGASTEQQQQRRQQSQQQGPSATAAAVAAPGQLLPGGGLPGAAAAGGGEAAAAAAATAGGAAPASSWPPCWRMRWSTQQSGLLRFNCADSLDRTNAATCFAMLPVLQEQLRVLGVTLECAVPPGTAALMRSRQRASAGDVAALAAQQQQQQGQGDALDAAAGGLPEGWEVRQHEGRLLYIDHINKTTQWTPPPSPSPAPTSGGGGSRPGSRPGSAANPLSARMIQSASDMLARLQQRSAASPGSSSSGGGAAAAAGPAGSSLSPAKGTPLQRLERRSSPPRMPHEGGSAGSGGHYWSRNSSSGSLNGMVTHAASAPDVTLASSRPSTAGSEVLSSPSVPERDPRRPWAFFDYDINDVRERLYKDAVSDYVEMFRVHGDIHSFLYTGSPAMHSHVLNLVVQGGKGYGATSGVGKLQNLRVAVQRRWNNTVSDTSRQQAMELFLGLRIHDAADQKGYFPGLQLVYRDSTQFLLGGMEAFESLPLPAPHSRHTSGSAAPSGPGPLAAGPPAVAAAAAAALPDAPLSELEEEGGSGRGRQARGGQGQGRADGSEFGGCEDRAHAVPGVPAVEHDGVLGVRQSLLDLEPLPDLTPQVQQRLQRDQQQLQAPPPAQQQQHEWEPPSHLPAHSSSSVESVPSATATPLAAFDPLGAVLHPAATPLLAEQHEGASAAGGAALAAAEDVELIDFDGSSAAAGAGGTGAAPATSTATGAVRTQLQDLLL